MVNACMISRGFCKKLTYEPNTVFRALLDTGAWSSATCHKELIMDYPQYTSSFSRPVHLTGAITEYNSVSQSITPLGEDYVLVPSRFPQRDYVRVKIYCSPHLTGTIIKEEDIMGDTNKDRVNLFGLTLHKYYLTEDGDIDTWKLQVRHQSTNSARDILITGIQNEFGKCCTEPLLFPGKIHRVSPLATVNTNVDLALVDNAEFRKDYDVAVA